MTDKLIEAVARAICTQSACAPTPDECDLCEQNRSDSCRNSARAAIAAIEASGTHRVVPVEPTVGMFAALTKNLDSDIERRAAFMGVWLMGTFNEDYAAMLAAAPKVVS